MNSDNTAVDGEKSKTNQTPHMIVENNLLYVKNCIGTYNVYNIKEIITSDEDKETFFAHKRKIENERTAKERSELD